LMDSDSPAVNILMTSQGSLTLVFCGVNLPKRFESIKALPEKVQPSTLFSIGKSQIEWMKTAKLEKKSDEEIKGMISNLLGGEKSSFKTDQKN